MHTDNTTTLSAINKGTSTNQLVIQWLLKLFWLSATYNFHVTSQYIPTLANTLADAISSIRDPVHCALLVEKLISCLLNKRPCVTPHLSRNAFNALPLQVSPYSGTATWCRVAEILWTGFRTVHSSYLQITTTCLFSFLPFLWLQTSAMLFS